MRGGLSNATTIARTPYCSSVTYFHIELEQHAILFAEGLATESYLDSGGKACFESLCQPMALHPIFGQNLPAGTHFAIPCAPVLHDGNEVKPFWQRLADRAGELGHSYETFATTAEPDVHLLADGRRLVPFLIENGNYVFAIPASATKIRLRSRTGRPADLQPWLDDRRALGIMVSGIIISSGCRDNTPQCYALDDPEFSDGWHASEAHGVRVSRLTDGDASLPHVSGPSIVMIQVVSSGTYPVSQDSLALCNIYRPAAAK